MKDGKKQTGTRISNNKLFVDQKMNENEATKILEFVSDFQNKAQNIKRYEGNPYVNGDNIAEHLSRVIRLLFCIAPELKKEFPNNKNLTEEIAVCLLIHDDDEVIEGFDIPSPIKNHNIKDDEEIEKFKKSISNLSEDSRNLFISAFNSFRRKDSLAAKIAKVLDNIAGNQLVIEQKVGIISPNQAKFSIEYVEKVRGISKTTDAIIDAQIDQVIEFREYLKLNPDKLKNLVEPSLIQKAKDLLKIDISSYQLNKDQIFAPLEKL